LIRNVSLFHHLQSEAIVCSTTSSLIVLNSLTASLVVSSMKNSKMNDKRLDRIYTNNDKIKSTVINGAIRMII